jgi:hypothetical protein
MRSELVIEKNMLDQRADDERDNSDNRYNLVS